MSTLAFDLANRKDQVEREEQKGQATTVEPAGTPNFWRQAWHMIILGCAAAATGMHARSVAV